MSCCMNDDDPFPADECLFTDTFSKDSVYNVMGQELSIIQLFGANLGVAALVWESAVQLCRYFEGHSVEWRGRRVIELGSGTGVVGIVAARLGADVTLTDLPMTLPQLEANVCANMPSSGWPSAPPTVLPLSWGEDHMKFPSDWDLVLGADIVYIPKMFPLLVDTLAHLCRKKGVVYLSCKMRKEHKTASFFKEHLPTRFNVQLVHRYDNLNINIYRASSRKAR
ncbi:EEF1A lysine methyltransferase 3-like [Syngnathus scovelli]|uniref:EEF1A lysine methyltransferase 3-like n=1 Tax=Syngnathus scovelli TaxID=161590 RepID=UPI0021102A11|nr:EEF1A lysine methyltransferase 3-like [Syngnathus scovelli]